MKKFNFLMAILASVFALQLSWAQPGLYDVEAGAFYFSPSELTIEVGSTVTWINVGGFHDVNFVTNSITGDDFGNPEPFSLDAVYSAGPDSPAEIGSWTFTVEGDYSYDCSVGTHAAQGMIGTITVTPAGEYLGCMDQTACNYDPVANIDDDSCLYNDLCCEALTVECFACTACQTPEDWCLANPNADGCDAYDVFGCMDDGFQVYSPFPGIAADNYAEGANTECVGCCAYWGCGNPDNTLMLVGTFMDIGGDNIGWQGTSMNVTNVWEDSEIYELGGQVFYFSPTADIMYELPPLPTEDVAGAIDLSGEANELLDDGSENPNYNPNYGGDIPDGLVNHDDCLECPLNEDFVGNFGYVVNFCAPDDLLDGCYQLVVEGGDGNPADIAWQIQNAEISIFALTGSNPFDATSGSACDDENTGFDFYDIGIESASFEDGILSTQVCNFGNETTADADGNETFGTTWILIDGFAEISDSPSELTIIDPLGEPVTSGGYYWGSCYDFEYDLSEYTAPSVLGPGSHSITIWINGGASQPLGVNPEFSETYYENNYFSIFFEIPYVYGCMDPWASNYNPNANSDDDGQEPCYYVCGDTDGDGVADDDTYQSFTITCGGGSWQGEVGWTIQTIDGFEILSGGAPYDSGDYSEYGLCLAPGCYQVLMTDTYGDGWNGNDLEIGADLEFTIEGFASEGDALFEVGEGGCGEWIGCMDSSATNYSENAIQDDGSCEYDCSYYTDENGIPYESIELTCDGGSWQTEVGWEIVDANGDILMSGGAPAEEVACLPIGCYTVNMTDSFGDGWNGNELTIETGSGFTWSFVGPEDTYPNGTEGTGIFATGNPNNCGIYWGCTDPEADNYDEINTVDDGSCEYSCVNGGTLISVNMTDTYGDGWNGNILTITDAAGNTYDVTIYDVNGNISTNIWTTYAGGYASIENLCLEDGCATMSWTDSSFIGETEFTITDADGNVLAAGEDGILSQIAFGVNDDSCVTYGCTDDTAENYNPDATAEDGSCTYDCETWLDTDALYTCYFYVWVYNTYEYTVEMMEGYGYDCTCVENPIGGCTDPNADNYDPVATENDGTCDYTCDEDAGQVSTDITCDGGTWQGEITWQIYDEDDNIVASGGAPYANEICLIDDMCYSIEMQDSYGDGWNGNMLNIGGTEMSLYAGNSGNGIYNCVVECDFDEIPVSVENGTGTSFGFSITNGSGDIMVSGGNDFEGTLCLDPDGCYDVNLASSSGSGNEGASLLVGDDSFSWTGFSFWYAYHYEVVGGGCPVYGCTDPEADNYNPDATFNQVSNLNDSDPCEYWGCTDSNADNYDPTANVEDGSCDCGDSATAYIVNMTDTFGDGWNQNILTIGDSEFTILDANGDFTNNVYTVYEGGSFSQGSVCLEDGCYEITCDGGSWQGEVGWEILDSDGNVLLSGGAPFTTGLLAIGEGSCGDLIGCTDPEALPTSYNENAIQDDGSCEYGCLDENGEISEIFESVTLVCDGGMYQYEVYWNIEDADGNIVFEAGVDEGFDFGYGGIVNTWTCLDPDACYTINMTDDFGDGWNGNILTIGGDTEVSLWAGYAGTVEYGYCPYECDLTTYDVTVNNGSGTDFAFVVTDYDGTTVVSGGNDFSGPGCFDLENGCYTVSLSSAGGGGQGSASLSIGDEEFDWNDGTGGYWSSNIIEGLGSGCPTLGCTDETACNYNAEANLDNGSCWYSEDCENYCVTEDFDSFEDGTAVSESSLFSTWTGAATEEVYVSGGEISIDTGNDIVTTAPVFEDGSYTVSFDMNIPAGGDAYFNMGNSGNTANWQWEFEVYFYADGTAFTTQSYDIWEYDSGVVEVDVLIDLDNELASLQINGDCVETWNWTGALGGVNFFGWAGNPYTIDNFSLCAEDVAICISGCTNPESFNYNPDATEDDGSCVAVVIGCTDGDAWNYNELANTDDGSCVDSCADIGESELSVFMWTNGIVSGWYGSSINIGDESFALENYQGTSVSCIDMNECVSVTAGGGIQQYNIGWTLFVDGEEVLAGSAPFTGEMGSCDVDGCMDETACNYNSAATSDDNSCTYAGSDYDCDGNCYDDDGDNVCNIDEVDGCTDPNASNFDSDATEEDGSCTYAIYGCTNSAAANFDSLANTDDGSCDFGPWGETTTTDCNMTILIPGDALITVEGEEVTEAWIGVTDSEGNVCGSVLWTSGEVNSIAAWGDDSTDESDYGFDSGETINWIVYTDDGDIIGTVVFSFGEGIYSCGGLAGISSIDFVSTFTQEIELSTGWGIWSTYISPADYDMASVFTDVVDNLTIVKDESGQVYWPMFGLNSIGELTDGKGYQAKMSADDILVLEGNLVPSDLEMLLGSGWGIMGYLHLTYYNAVDMMAPVVDDLTILKDESGQVYWPMFGLNSIGNMYPDKGYQVKMENDAIFSYPSGGRFGFSDFTTVGKTVHYDTALNTGNNMIIGLPTTSWEVIPVIGDEISAYDELDRLIGSTVFNGDNIALTVWGDDLTTESKDGLSIGEKVTLKLWNSDMNTEETLIVTRWDAGSDAYTIDGISIASNIILSGDSSEDTYKLYQNVPNPFNGTTTIKFYVPENTEVTIGVYNILGEYVSEVTNDIFNVGKHEVVFNANELGQGTYFVRMTTEGFTATKSMNILK